MIDKNEQNVYDIFNLLGIKYVRYEHKPVYTVNEAKKLDKTILGVKCKNLFLENVKGDIHYIVILDENKRADLKLLAKQIGSTHLSFAPEDELYKYLKLARGSVTPFGIINDINSEVIILIDEDLMNAKLVNFHPNVNTATIGISYIDLEKFIKWHKNKFYCVKIN